MKILITGAAGFIGAHLAKHFISQGHEIYGLDNFSVGHHFDTEPLPDWMHFIDLRLYRPIESVDVIIHCAAISRVIANADDYQLNMMMLVNVLQTVKCKLAIFCSSSAVYGYPPLENKKPQPFGFYGLSKLHGEFYLKFLCDKKLLNKAIALRLPNVYGPGQNSIESGAVSIFLSNILEGKESTIRNGKHVRDYVYIDDIVRLFDMTVKAHWELGDFEAIPIGTQRHAGCWANTQELFELCGNIAGNFGKRIYSQDGGIEMENSLQFPDNLLGWKPIVTLKEGVKKTWEWVQAGKPYFA